MRTKRLIAAAALALPLSGCSLLFERTLAPNAEVATDQQYQSLPAIVQAAGGNLDGLVSDLSVETTQEPVLHADGTPMLDGNGNPIFRTVTRRERGLPMAPGRTRFEAGGKFVDAKVAASIHNNPDGSALDFSQASSPDGQTYAVGAQLQAARDEIGAKAAVGITEMARLAAGDYFALLRHKETEETSRAKLELDHAAEMARLHGEGEGGGHVEAPTPPEGEAPAE